MEEKFKLSTCIQIIYYLDDTRIIIKNWDKYGGTAEPVHISLRTERLKLEIKYEIILSNIIIEGRNLHLSNSGKKCLKEEEGCCNEDLLYKIYHMCYLHSKYYSSFVEENFPSSINGLFEIYSKFSEKTETKILSFKNVS